MSKNPEWAVFNAGTCVAAYGSQTESDVYAKKTAAECPGSDIAVYRRVVVYSSKIIVEDDYPKEGAK